MNKHFRFMLISLLILGMGCGVAMAAAPTLGSPTSPTSGLTTDQFEYKITFTDVDNDLADHVDLVLGSTIYNMTTTDSGNTSDGFEYTTGSIGPFPANTYSFSYSAANGSDVATPNHAGTLTVTEPPLAITSQSSPQNPSTQQANSQDFTVDTNRIATVQWFIDGNVIETDANTMNAAYSNNTALVGVYNVTVLATNASESVSYKWDWTVTAIPAPQITGFTPNSGTVDTVTSASETFSITADQTVDVAWFIGSTEIQNSSSTSYTNSSAEVGSYTVKAFIYNANGNNENTWTWNVANASLSITDSKPSDNTPESTVNDLQNFNATTNQACTFKWYVDNALVQTDSGVTFSSYNNTPNSATDYDVRVNVSNVNGDESEEWDWTVRPANYFSGDRIWDENAGQSTKYTWNALSYSGFFYDLDSGQGSETMTMDDIDRNIGKGDLVYETTPITTDFEYGAWGSYQVIGFMAEKYFAGYTSNSVVSDNDAISLISKGHLTKVLMDDDDKHSVYGGAGLTLEEGYVLNVVQVDKNGDKIFVTLSKDGDEVNSDVLSSGATYIYEKDLGDVDDVPIIAVKVDEIFSGTESNAVFIEGIFQISDKFEDIDNGDEYGAMEITSIGATKIKMKNHETIGLDEGDEVDIMGKLKFIVADDNDLRFAPFVDMSEPGTYELRGTIAENTKLKWTPLNFEGFYYNIDEGIGTESLEVLVLSGDDIDEGDLVYTTKPADVGMEYGAWGNYSVVGFMAEKYFAGYPDDDVFGSGTNDAVSMMAKGQLSKVLIDDDDKKSVFGGSSIVLEEGYSLDIVEVNKDGDKVIVELSKDGDSLDTEVLSSGSAYIYEKDLGDVDDVPIIAVNFDEIFSGTESTAVFIRGIFQISDDYEEIEDGDSYDNMEVTGINANSIIMENKDDITLSEGDEIEIMGDIKFKVADDSNNVRYYPYVEKTGESLNSLDIEIDPEIASEGDKVTVTVTSRGSLVNGVTVKAGSIVLGTTDDEGEVDYTFHTDGTYTLTAEKEGYVNGEKSFEVISKDDESRKMSIEVSPEVIYEGNLVTFTVVKSIGGDAISDAEVTIDGKSIGDTDSDGVVTDVLKEVGMHKIIAEKEGFIDEELNIEVKELEAKFEFSNLVVTPLEVKTGKTVMVTLDASNTGKAAGSYTVELLVNDNTTATQEITLEVGASTKVEFEYTTGDPGTYLVKVEGMTAAVEVVEGASTLLYLGGAGAIAVLGGAVYLFTAGGWTVSTAGAKAGEAVAVLSEKLSSLLSRGK